MKVSNLTIGYWAILVISQVKLEAGKEQWAFIYMMTAAIFIILDIFFSDKSVRSLVGKIFDKLEVAKEGETQEEKITRDSYNKGLSDALKVIKKHGRER